MDKMLNFNNINLYNPLYLIKGKENNRSGNFSNLKYRYNYSNDIVDFMKQDNISFSGQKLFKALEYIQEKTNRYVVKGFKPNSLEDFNLYKLEGILEGTVFDGLSMEDFFDLCNSLENILLIRGCSNGCVHCYANAKPFKQGITGEIGTIAWKDFINLTDSIEEIIKRFGFNPFEKSKNGFYPFHDGDLVHLKSYDDKGNPHNMAEAIKYFYDKTGIQLHITTAGWDKEETWTQNAVKEFIKNTSVVPLASPVVISIHPFHKYMNTSIKLKEASKKIQNTEKRELFEEKSQKYRQKYVDRMSNVLKTFLPLLKSNQANVSLLYAHDQGDIQGYSSSATKTLFKEILDNLKKICKPEDFTDQDKERLLQYIDKMHEIAANGKGKRFFNQSKTSRTVNYYMTNEISVDINGKVFVIDSPRYTYPSMGMQLNYINKDKKSHR